MPQVIARNPHRFLVLRGWQNSSRATLSRQTAPGVFLFATCLLAPLTLAQVGTPPAQNRPTSLCQLTWSELEFSAHKLIFSAKSTMRVELIPAAAAARDLRPSPSGTPVTVAEGEVAVLTVKSELPFGRHELAKLWLDPHSGAVLQCDKLTTGRKPYRKIWRYLKEGVYSWRWSPAKKSEEKKPPTAWTKIRQNLSPLPSDLPPGSVLTDSYALLPLLTGARLDAGGIPLRLFVIADDRLVEASLTPDRLKQIKCNRFDPQNGSEPVGIQPIITRVVRLSARPVTGGEGENDVDLGFLGLKGDVTLFVDLATGIPLSFSGRADYVGEVTVELTRMAAKPAKEPTPSSN